MDKIERSVVNGSLRRSLRSTFFLIAATLLLAYLVPNYGPRVLGNTPVTGALLFSFWILALAPGVFASAACVGAMRHQSAMRQCALFLLAAFLCSVLTAMTLSFAALSDQSTAPGFFGRIFASWWIYAFGAGASGFIVLLEYGGEIVRFIRWR